VNDLTGEGEGRSSEREKSGCDFDLPATELSPSLLAIEAELRGVSLQAGHARTTAGDLPGADPRPFTFRNGWAPMTG